MISIKNIFPLSTIAAILMLASCGHKEQQQPESKGTLLLHIHTYIGSSEAEYGDTFTTKEGRKMTLSLAQFYVSGIKLVKTDGSTVDAPNVTLLKTVEQEQYIVGDVPAGNYKSVQFSVGVQPGDNTKDPASQQAGTALAAHTPSMWFGAGKGYIFLNVAGTIDTSANKNGEANYPFSFQIGSNALLKMVTLPDKNFTVVPNQAQEVHMLADYGELFKGLDVKTENSTTTYDKQDVANKVANNIPSIFDYEE